MPNLKARQIQKVHALLKKTYEPPPKLPALSMLEALIMAVLSDGTTSGNADAVFRRLKERYYDWNEVRVSALVELQENLADLPDAEQRAARLKNGLKYIFETTYGFDLEAWKKLPMKEVARRLSKMPGCSPYLIDRVIRDGMGGNTVPLDSAAVRVLSRVALVDGKTNAEILAGSLERLLPRSRSFELCHLLSEHAARTCTETEPRCKPCVLLDLCSFGQNRLRELAAAAAAAAASAKRARARAKSKTSRSKAR
jgi:endonuclease-3